MAVMLLMLSSSSWGLLPARPNAGHAAIWVLWACRSCPAQHVPAPESNMALMLLPCNMKVGVWCPCTRVGPDLLSTSKLQIQHGS